jgi:Lipocalin-like domain
MIMKRISIFISLPILLALSGPSCKKNNSGGGTDPNAITMANLSGVYTITDIKGTASGLTVDIYSMLPDCEKDNLIKLNSGGTAAIVDAGTVCAPPSDTTGTWTLVTSTDSLLVTGLGANHVESYNSGVLVLKGNQVVSGTAFLATTTLTKQ